MTGRDRRRFMSWFRTERERPEPTPVLEYRAPPGTQTIDNSEEFERFRRCVEEGKDPIEGRHSYTGRGIRREHLTRTPFLMYGGCSDSIQKARKRRDGRIIRRKSGR